LINDAPPNEGFYSLLVSGGCAAPHIIFEFPNELDSGFYFIEFWGKNLEIGGTVTLTYSPQSDYPLKEIIYGVMDTTWYFYTKDDHIFAPNDGLLFLPQNKKLEVHLTSGGFVPSAMLIDGLNIYKSTQ
jgi:hypothetical protein